MAFPTVSGTATGQGGSSTSHSVPLPSSSAGNLIVLHLAYGAGNNLVTPSGWTKIAEVATRRTATVIAKVADGGEGASVNVTWNAASNYASIAYVVTGFDEGINGIEGSGAEGLDVPSLSPSWGSGETLWLAFAKGQASDYTFDAAPANYTTLLEVGNASSSAGSRVRAASARRSLDASSDDPGSFTDNPATSALDPVVFLVGIRPEGIVTPINPVVDSNGFDIVVDSTNTTVGNWTVEAGAGGSETGRTVQSVRQINATQVRIRLANGNRILSGESVLVSSTADGTTDEAATNGSDQTSTTVVIETSGGGLVSIPFSGSPSIGMTRAGRPQITNATITALPTYTPGTGEEQYRVVASAVDLDISDEQCWHPDATGYNASLAASYPLSLTADQTLMVAVVLPDVSARTAATAYSLGDVVLPDAGTRFFRCTTAGTTDDPLASLTTGDTTKTDGTVVWTRGGSNSTGDNGRSLVRHMAMLACAGTALKSQDSWACSFAAGSNRVWYTGDDLLSSKITSVDTGFNSASDQEGQVRWPWWERGTAAGGNESQSMPEESMGHPYGRDMAERAGQAFAAIMGTSGYKDTLVDYVVQRAIDYVGLREAGLYIGGFEGWTQGREQLCLIGVGLLGIDINTIRAPAVGSLSTNPWRGFHIAEQVGYVGDGQDGAMAEGYDYFDGYAGTYVEPTSDPTSYPNNGGAPATSFFPASVRNDWRHTPEIGGRFALGTSGDDVHPTWINPTSTTYRALMSTHLPLVPYIWQSLELGSQDAAIQAYHDYNDRFEYIGGNSSFTDLLSIYESGRPDFAFTALADPDGMGVTLTFNRYATATNTNWLARLAISGVTLSNPTHVGPRVWHFDADADVRGSDIVYTASAGNDAVDAGNNALGTQTVGITEPVAGGGGRSNLRPGIRYDARYNIRSST